MSETALLPAARCANHADGAPLHAVQLIVIGEPATQGSKKAFYNARIGRAIMTEQTSAKLNPWRADVTLAALRNREERGFVGQPAEPLDGPLMARVVFTMKKPSSAPKTRRTWPAKGKDLSKLLRALEDAITAAGLWRDDSRVVEYQRLAKVYAGEDPEALDVPGVRIAVWTISEAAQPALELSPAFPTACAETPSKEGASSDPTNDR